MIHSLRHTHQLVSVCCGEQMLSNGINALTHLAVTIQSQYRQSGQQHLFLCACVYIFIKTFCRLMSLRFAAD